MADIDIISALPRGDEKGIRLVEQEYGNMLSYIIAAILPRSQGCGRVSL